VHDEQMSNNDVGCNGVGPTSGGLWAWRVLTGHLRDAVSCSPAKAQGGAVTVSWVRQTGRPFLRSRTPSARHALPGKDAGALADGSFHRRSGSSQDSRLEQRAGAARADV
jgi:hypothetical protein